MTPKEKAKFLVNEQYYQPLTLHLNISNNSKQMWDYAKRCAHIAVDEIIEVAWWSSPGVMEEPYRHSQKEYWIEVKKEIELS